MITDGNNYCLYNEDCLTAMRYLPDGCVDMVLCDLPYGTTQNKWDAVIPFEPLWKEYRRVAKKNAAIVLTAAQPFTSALVMSNVRDFLFDYSWKKSKPTGHLSASKRPMRSHEDILVFCGVRSPTYNPQMMPKETGKIRSQIAVRTQGNCYNTSDVLHPRLLDKSVAYPQSTLFFNSAFHDGERGHPTQKPVALMEYLIRTYTNEGETVLDNTMGSGTTGVACMNTKRRFIGMEKDTEHGYFEIATKRIQEAARC